MLCPGESNLLSNCIIGTKATACLVSRRSGLVQRIAGRLPWGWLEFDGASSQSLADRESQLLQWID